MVGVRKAGRTYDGLVALAHIADFVHDRKLRNL